MSDEAAFLKAIQDNPKDDTVRLVYADWLDEHGDPRAEFIRLRQELARITARINELAGQCDPSWLAAVGGPPVSQGEIPLLSGRTVTLQSLQQSSVYAGLLEGLPTTEMNERIIEQYVAEQRTRTGQEPYLIRPGQRPLKYRDDRPYPFGKPAAIPGIGCVGLFHSHQPARAKEHDYSDLVVIWFQNSFAFPIDPAVREHIRAIDWEKHAADFSW